MKVFDLRKEVWGHTQKIILKKEEYASKLGEGGADRVNILIKKLKSIQYNLGVAEFELQIPGAILSNAFKENINDVVNRVKSFTELLDGKMSKETAKEEEQTELMVILDDLTTVVNWVKEKKPLVTENDLSDASKDDKEQLVRMLTGSDNEDGLFLVIPIIFEDPGMNKTTLASHVYHDSSVQGYFSRRHWVCMSGTPKRRSILMDQVFRRQTSDNDIRNKFHHLVNGERYLLILDGVTEVVPGKFLDELLSQVGKGSKILLTTSSIDTLANLAPLAVVNDPFQLDRYKKLPPTIRQCVNYCSLFPKHYEFNKKDLIHLWLAHDLLVGEGIPEDVAGDKYFMDLENKGYFFKNNERGSKGVIVCYKMRHLQNELIRDFAKPEFCLGDESTEQMDYKSISHLSFIVDSLWKAPSWLVDAKQLLSLLILHKESFNIASISNIDEILSSLKCLRALDLAAVNCEDLQESLGNLQELKYLRLGRSSHLPECILKLQNLQILDLRYSKVRELPKDFYKLSNLRHFYSGDQLDDLPPNFGELKSLQTLDVFIVGENNGIDALAQLKHVCGKLKIHYKKHYENNNVLSGTDEVLKDKNLTDLSFTWQSYLPATADEDILQLPSTLKSLKIRRCKGVVFPKSVIEEFHNLCCLVSVDITECSKCSSLPSLSILPFLKSLSLWDLAALEYIENGGNNNRMVSSVTEYYPSLEHLTLATLPKLRGWSRGNHQQLQFPRLAELKISGCLEMMSMPGAPSLESLEVENIHENLLKHLLSAPQSPSTLSERSKLKVLQITSVQQLDSLSINQSTLESFEIKGCLKLSTLNLDTLTRLQKFEIHECGKLMSIRGGALKHLSVDWKKGIMKGWN